MSPRIYVVYHVVVISLLVLLPVPQKKYFSPREINVIAGF